MGEKVFLRALLISLHGSVNNAWKLEEDDGVGFTGKIDIVLATWEGYESRRRGWGGEGVNSLQRPITTNIVATVAIEWYNRRP